MTLTTRIEPTCTKDGLEEVLRVCDNKQCEHVHQVSQKVRPSTYQTVLEYPLLRTCAVPLLASGDTVQGWPLFVRAGSSARAWTCLFASIAIRPEEIIAHCEQFLTVGESASWHWPLRKKSRQWGFNF